MAIEDAMQALACDANQEINAAIGDLLRDRGNRDDWRDCPILQHLEVGAWNLSLWNQLFHGTRLALADGADLPRKARTVLRPGDRSFDLALDDFIAEMAAAQYLALLGHEGICFVPEDDAVTADLMSVHKGVTYITEAKNLREPRSLTYIAFARWHRNRASNPQAYSFNAEFLEIDDPFEDLTAAQANAVQRLIDTLPNRDRPATFNAILPGDRTMRVRIAAGAGVLLGHGPGPFLVNAVVRECERAAIIKLLEPARKALTQLYSTAVPSDYRKLLFVRWKPPEELPPIGETNNVRTTLQRSLQTFLRQFFPEIAVAIIHTNENLENAPRAAWD
jgi:hypothetical protein